MTKKEISIKINSEMSLNAHGQVDYYPASYANDPGSAPSEGGNLFFCFFFSFFFLLFF